MKEHQCSFEQIYDLLGVTVGLIAGAVAGLVFARVAITTLLLAAPAGFGKTTLIAEWLATSAEGRVLRTELAQLPNNSVLSPHHSALSMSPSSLLLFLIATASAASSPVSTSMRPARAVLMNEFSCAGSRSVHSACRASQRKVPTR